MLIVSSTRRALGGAVDAGRSYAAPSMRTGRPSGSPARGRAPRPSGRCRRDARRGSRPRSRRSYSTRAIAASTRGRSSWCTRAVNESMYRVGLRRVAEELHQPLVPVQRVRDQVPVEAADVAAAKPRSGRTVLIELRDQRAALELGRHRPARTGQVASCRSRERVGVIHAQDADPGPRPRSARRGSSRSPRAHLREGSGASARTSAARLVRPRVARRGRRHGDLLLRASETWACAAPSRRALSAARRAASPGASASTRRAASIRAGSPCPRGYDVTSVLGGV